MTEKILSGKKNGMFVLILDILAELASIALFVYGVVLIETAENLVVSIILTIVGGILICIVWIPLLGLRVLKPQEALVLTLFGKYIGTLKGDASMRSILST